MKRQEKQLIFLCERFNALFQTYKNSVHYRRLR